MYPFVTLYTSVTINYVEQVGTLETLEHWKKMSDVICE